MARRLKEMIVEDLDRRFGLLQEAVMVDFSKLDAESNRSCRADFRKVGITVNVVKNSLVRRVFASRGMEFPEETWSGPVAILVGEEDAITTSKVVADWRRSHRKEMALKGGLLEGEVLGPNQAEQLTKMPSVQESRQMLVSAIAGPLTALVGITSNVLSGVPGVLQAIADKHEGE